MADEERRPAEGDQRSALIQTGRLELRGTTAIRVLRIVGYSLVTLIASAPGAMALFAYAEGGTSLWAAIAFAVAVPGGIALWLLRAR